jgi:hypothetical protein
MMRKILTFVIPIALAACASGVQESTPASGAASTAKAERPDVKVGDRWVSACTQYSKKFDVVTVVTSVDQSGIKGTQNGVPLVLTPDLNEIEGMRWSHSPDNRYFRFPLEVGKKWSDVEHWVDHSNSSEGSTKVNATVTSYEKVRVKAGEFDAFRIKWKGSWSANNDGAGVSETTYWYAPAARGVVKSEMIISWPGGGEPEFDCELAQLQLQP